MAKSVKQPVETPPYLKQVRIRDYAPLRDAKVDFKPGLNIIIGSNGAGKTRFISLASRLLYLAEEQFDGIDCELTLGGRYEIKVRFEEQPYDEGGRRIPIKDNEPLVIIGTRNEVTKSANMLEYVIEDLTDGYGFHYSVILVKHGIPTTRLLVADESIELMIGKRGGVISVDSGTTQVENVESRLVVALIRGLISVIRGGPSVIKTVAQPLVTIEKARELVEQTLSSYLSRFNQALPLYSPIKAVRHNEVFQVYRNPAQEEIIIKGLVLEYQVDSTWLPFRALSDGTRRLFYLIAEMLSPSGLSFDGKKKEVIWRDADEIIFLEEPELGIHPDQLQKLLTLIREVSDKHQVIMTTHSPQVLDMLRKDELDRITICELDPKKGTQFRKLSAATKAKAKAYMRDDSYLSDFWRFSTLERRD